MTKVHDLTVTTVPLDQLKGFPGNARRGAIAELKEVIVTNGFAEPIAVQASTMHIISGNHRWQALKELRDEGRLDLGGIPAYLLDVSDEEATRLNIAANRLNDLATNDEQALIDLLTGLDSTAGTGYTDDDLADMLNDLDLEAEGLDVADEPTEDVTPDRGALLKLADLGWNEPRTETHQGEHWLLGHHHLFIVDVNRDHAVYTPHLDEATLFAPYPNPHLTGTITARETPLIMVQPRPLLAAHIIDKFIALFGDDEVRKVQEAEAA